MLPAITRVQELNPAKLGILFKKEFELCKVNQGETVMLLTDLATRREYVEAAFAAAEDLGADVYEMCVNSIPPGPRSAFPPSASARAPWKRPRPRILSSPCTCPCSQAG